MRTSFIASFLYGAATFHIVKGSIISIAVPQTIGFGDEITVIFYNSNEQAYYQPVATIFGFDTSGHYGGNQIGAFYGGISFLGEAHYFLLHVILPSSINLSADNVFAMHRPCPSIWLC
jgi:hypothetical protein